MDFCLLLKTWVKFFYSAKKSKTDFIKTASKSATKKTAESAGDLIGNKIATIIQKHLVVYDSTMKLYQIIT